MVITEVGEFDPINWRTYIFGMVLVPSIHLSSVLDLYYWSTLILFLWCMQMARGRKTGGTNNRGNNAGQGIDPNGIVNLVAQAMQTQNQLQQQLVNLQNQNNHNQPNQNGGSLKTHFESMRKARAPNYEGGADPEKAEKWVGELETNFRMLEVPEGFKAELAASFLTGEGEKWWKAVGPTLPNPTTWEQFKDAFLKTYYPESIRIKRVSEFNSLRQNNDMSVIEYTHKFNTLGRFVPGVMGDEKFKMLRFKEGLLSHIQTGLV